MRCSRLLLRLAFSCVLLGTALARPADAQAERSTAPEAEADTTAQDTTAQDSSFFDAQIATGHKPRRRGVRRAPTARREVPEPRPIAPAVSTATASDAPPEDEAPRRIDIAPVSPQPDRSGAGYEAVTVTRGALNTPNAAPMTTRPAPEASEPEPVSAATLEPLATDTTEPEIPEPLVADLPAEPLAPEVETVDAPEETAPVVVPEIAPEASGEATAAVAAPQAADATGKAESPEAAPSLFDTRIASGHKDLADVPPPTFFDTRIASGHKDLAERDDLMFDARVAEGHKVLPMDEPLAQYEAAVGVAAAGQFVVSPEGLDVVLAEAVRVGRLFNTSGKRRRMYFPMIETTLARRGLPLELKYLALIESSMDPLAVSHAGARGLWQIMPETAGDFGADSMAVHDPKLATAIAAQYLERLHRMFDGDWLLALAAYNSGPGRVQGFVRGFERSEGRTPTYWDIRSRLPRETRDYVPRFLAAVFYAQSDV